VHCTVDVRPTEDDQMASRWLAFPALIVAAATSLLVCWWVGRPVHVPDAPSDTVPCVSYAPFRDGQTPFDRRLVVPPEQIAEDLRLLARTTSCIRTYSVALGLSEVPRLAREVGLQVMLGAWIGRKASDNALELARAVAIANDYPGTVRALIVGNEVLLRRELPSEELSRLIRWAKEGTSVPITYADVWEFWLKNPRLISDVDFITIHILPYWEDQPVGIERAADHVATVWRGVRSQFSTKPLFVGETGWPSAGRMREGAAPGRVNQARFVREILQRADADGIGINMIEAFDQPWKRALEGTVGGHWGLFTAARQPKFPLSGPVSDVPAWRERFVAGAVLGALPLLWPWFRRRPLSLWAWLVLAMAGQAAGAVLVEGGAHIVAASHAPHQWITGVLRWLLAAMTLGLVVHVITVAGSGRPTAVRELVDQVRRRRLVFSEVPAALGWLSLAALFGAAAAAIGLAVDPRYRDFPLSLYAVPAVALAAVAWHQRRDGQRLDLREEMFLAVCLVLCGAVPVIVEGLANVQALAWAAVTGLLAAPPLVEAARARRRVEGPTLQPEGAQ
jgi:glucan 1,3-beta-glucosidase